MNGQIFHPSQAFLDPVANAVDGNAFLAGNTVAPVVTTSTSSKVTPTTTSSTPKSTSTSSSSSSTHTTVHHTTTPFPELSPTTHSTHSTIHTTHVTPKPSPTHQVKLAATSVASSGLSQISKGKGTYFTPNQGACGDWNTSADKIVALNAAQYGNMNEVSKYCLRMVEITGPKGTATAEITDACPGCAEGSLDMTLSLFEELGDPLVGVIPIIWHFIN